MSIQEKDSAKFYNHFEQFFKQSQDAMSVFDMKNRIITCNPAFEKLYGWTLEECKGKPIHFYPEDELMNVQERLEKLKKGISFSYKRVIEKRKDGSTFHAEMNMTPIFNEQDEVIAISYITRDITSQLKLEQKSVELIKLQNIRIIAAALAHEIRNPLTAISGFTQIMNEDPKNPYQHFTNTMVVEVAKVNQIITDFLSLAAPSFHNHRRISIVEIIDELLHDFTEKFTTYSISCHFIKTTPHAVVLGNSRSLQQGLYNVLSNSYEAIAQNGQIDITVKEIEQSICITIQDNGCGMSPSTLKAIDQPFYTTKENGSGLGILILKKIIFDHQGCLEIESVENVGTKTTIFLPLADKSFNE
ncbi:PAS domain S-box protein [Sporosarcina sp. PTS2304]|uniref:two-component system sensor histidine kinase NtrB n=1 Tax=Sporosarcina sp. PTS2304 TaxID=2283194 RepID=UPI000E0D41BC|nr:PAS domain S-box protein [Sporosarcina sp. PTS2304]AXH98539.1 PAS domain S-box protein [Sporosarcina sp. PTS2304]